MQAKEMYFPVLVSVPAMNPGSFSGMIRQLVQISLFHFDSEVLFSEIHS